MNRRVIAMEAFKAFSRCVHAHSENMTNPMVGERPAVITPLSGVSYPMVERNAFLSIHCR